jgi:DNA-binding MarR family transcriptional regulator
MTSDPDLMPESPFSLLADDEIRAWYAYQKLQLRLRYEMNRQLRADSNISLADFDVLVALTSEPEGTMSVSALATRIGWERSRVSHHVRRMAARDLVVVAASAADKRVSEVALSPTGLDTLRESSREHVALVRRMFFDGLDGQRLTDLASTLEDIYERVIEHGTLPRPEDHP